MSHVLEVHFARVGAAAPSAGALDRLDALCRETGRANDLAVIDRAFGGCALVVRGVSTTPPAVRLREIGTSSESWGRPLRFHAVEEERGDEGPACGGDLMAVEVGVLRLTDLCHGFVREWMVTEHIKQAQALRAQLDETRAATEKAEQKLEAALATARAAAAAESGQPSNRKKKRNEREERRIERERHRQRTHEQRLRVEVNRLAAVTARLQSELEDVERRQQLYGDDPYLLRAREHTTANRDVAPPVDPL